MIQAPLGIGGFCKTFFHRNEKNPSSAFFRHIDGACQGPLLRSTPSHHHHEEGRKARRRYPVPAPS
jgi:hypothetical protein